MTAPYKYLSRWAYAWLTPMCLIAALLAADGLTGPAPIFEGEMGFFTQVSGEFDLPALGGENGQCSITGGPE